MEKSNEKIHVSTVSVNDVEKKKKSFWHINREMLPYKLHFFLFVGGMGAVLPFQSVLGITRLGLTASNIAAAYTAQQFLFVLFKPGIGYLADYFNKLKATIITLTILQAIFIFLMIIIPSVDVESILPTDKSNETVACDLCDRYLDFDEIPMLHSTDERKISESYLKYYLNGGDSFFVECPQHDNFLQPSSSYHLYHGTWNTSISDEFPVTNVSNINNEILENILIIPASINNSSNSSIFCSSHEMMSLMDISFSYQLHNKKCMGISGSLARKLQEKFSESKFGEIKCDNSTQAVLPRDGYNPELSAANFKRYQFWLFTLCLVASCTCISSLFTMGDTACYESVHGVDFGRQRVWGAVSWGLMAPLAGFLNDYTDSYMASWGLMVLFCSLQIWNLTNMKLVKPDFSESILKDVKTVFKSAEFLAFEVGVFMNGLFTGVIWFYLTWFLNLLGANKLVIGLAHFVQCYFGELPLLFISNWMIKKFGHFNLVSLALFTHGVRFFIYSYIHNPWWILPVECLHGFTFGSFYPAMTSYAKLNAKPGIEATTQSILCATYEALGAGLGCVISGIFFDHFGAHRTFFYTSFICALATLINVIFTILVQCRKGDLKVTEKVINARY